MYADAGKVGGEQNAVFFVCREGRGREFLSSPEEYELEGAWLLVKDYKI